MVNKGICIMEDNERRDQKLETVKKLNCDVTRVNEIQNIQQILLP